MSNGTSAAETYDWADADDRTVGSGGAADAHSKGLFTRSVHILVLDETGRALVCMRAASKRHYPGLLTSSAGGRVEPGETYAQAARRELAEETGLDIRIEDIGRFDVINATERSIHHLFIGTLPPGASVTTDPTEVESSSFMAITDLWKEASASPSRCAPPFLGALDCYLAERVKRLWVFDFDHTIFDWYGYKAALERHLSESLGIKPDMFRDAKEAHEAADGLYDIRQHMERLADMTDIPIETVRTASDEIAARATEFVYPDAAALLENLRAGGHHMRLITYGNPANQRYFVEATGIPHYFESIDYAETKQGKIDALRTLMNDPVSITVVNDDPGETELIRSQLPLIRRIFLVERSGAKYASIPSSDGWKVVTSLADIAD